jgi:phosphoribosylglycinamide formyltransferase-1
MVVKLGWFSTGRDEAARELLQIVVHHISNGTIHAEIRYVFCNRERGESLESDRFIELAEKLRIPIVLFSSRDFLSSLRDKDKEEWRSVYHLEIEKRIRNFQVDTVVLAGYMLIVSPSFCDLFPIINLHPAAPRGPKGTWQQVIWTLIQKRASETGVMMHLVTKDLDEGPSITYVTFPIKGPNFDPLWRDLGRRLKDQPLEQLIKKEGEDNPLFKEIRRQGVMRELPLIVMTLKALAEGRVRIEYGKVLDERGKRIEGYCLNDEVEEYLLKIPSTKHQ